MTIDLDRQPEILRYLAELDGRLAVLPADYRAEVMDGIREHLAASLAAGAEVSEALAALGRPEEIAAGAVRESGAWPVPAAPQAAPQPMGAAAWPAVLALILLAVGGLIGPVLGWLVGVMLLWLSDRWTVAQKLTGCLAAPLFMVLAAAAGYTGALNDELPGLMNFSPLDGARGALLLQLVVVVWLAVKMRRNGRA